MRLKSQGVDGLLAPSEKNTITVAAKVEHFPETEDEIIVFFWGRVYTMV